MKKILKFIVLNIQKFAHTINAAEKWQPEILAIINQNTLSAPFITSNVDWLDAKTFHFTQMSVSGYQDHVQTGGWNVGTIIQTDVPFTLTHDRDIEFLVDKRQVDETNSTIGIQNVTSVFTQTQQAPEVDAFFFSSVTADAVTAGLDQAFAIASYDVDNVYPRLKAGLLNGKLRLYKQRGSLIGYVNSIIMDLLERSSDFQRKIEMTNVMPDGTGLNTRITSIDGVTIVEVIDDERFWDSFDFSDGFVPPVGAFKINWMFVSVETVKTVPKIASVYGFAPGAHTKGDGWLYQNRSHWDTFVFPNGKDGNIDSIFVELDTVAKT